MFDPQFLKTGFDQGDLGCSPLSQYAVVAGHSLKHVEHWVSEMIRPVSCIALKQAQRPGHRYFAHVNLKDVSLSFIALGNDAQAFSEGDDHLFFVMLVNGISMRCPTGSLAVGQGQDVLVLLPGETYNSLLSANAQKVVIRVSPAFIKQHDLDLSALPNQASTLAAIQALTYDLLGQLMVSGDFSLAEQRTQAWGEAIKRVLLSKKNVELELPGNSRLFSYARLPSYIQMFLGWVQVQACDSKMPDMLDLLPVSTRKFYSDFQAHIGCSPYQYLKLHRLRRVRMAMLMDPSQNLSDVASFHGFSHLGRFSSYFKQVFGTLPSQLRTTDAANIRINIQDIIARTGNLCWVEGDHRSPVKALDMRCQHCIRKLTAY